MASAHEERETTSYVIRETRTEAASWCRCTPRQRPKPRALMAPIAGECTDRQDLSSLLVGMQGGAVPLEDGPTVSEKIRLSHHQVQQSCSLAFTQRAETRTEMFTAVLTTAMQTGSKQNTLSKRIKCDPPGQWNMTQH